MQIIRTIDHLVYAVTDFEKAFDDFEKLLGVRPTFGGYHTTKGTQNALINLGNECYLEILAIDENNLNIQPARWMGIDLIQNPTMTRWCLKSADLEKDAQILKNHNLNLGEVSGGQRKTADGNLLNWEMILPLAEPKIDLIPFMINWGESSFHPTANLEDICRLVHLDLWHPHPETIKSVFDELQLKINITKSKNIKITAHINSPNGIVEIS